MPVKSDKGPAGKKTNSDSKFGKVKATLGKISKWLLPKLRFALLVVALIIGVTLVIAAVYLKTSTTEFRLQTKPLSLAEYAASIGMPELLDEPLGAFFVNSSHNSYLAGLQVLSKPSTYNVVHAIRSGARCIEIDIHPFGDKPVVRHSSERLNGETADLDNVLYGIQQNAFLDTNDPLILYLEVFNTDNEKMVQSLAESIERYLGERLYEVRFSKLWQTGIVRTFIDEPVRSLLGKILVVVNYYTKSIDIRDKYLFPVAHGTTDEPQEGWLKDSKYRMKGVSSADPRARQTGFATRVYPANIVKSDNYDPTPYWLLEYSFVALNFGNNDEHLRTNARMFARCNFVLKSHVLTSRMNSMGRVLKPTRTYQGCKLYENETDALAVIHPGTAYRNYKWISNNGAYRLTMRPDGNLACTKRTTLIWSSDTAGNPGAVLLLRADGSLTIYDGQEVNPAILWQFWPKENILYAQLENDGTLEMHA